MFLAYVTQGCLACSSDAGTVHAENDGDQQVRAGCFERCPARSLDAGTAPKAPISSIAACALTALSVWSHDTGAVRAHPHTAGQATCAGTS